jgi:type IV pilus assembly protein PilM
MFDFGMGKKIFVGIDLGTSAIKMVELRISGGKPVLSNYAWMPIGDLAGVNDMNSTYLDIALPEYIKKMYKAAGFSGKDVYASIPAFGGLITLIELPEMSHEEMEQAIRFEAHKYIPTSLDEVVLSWDIVGEKKIGQEAPDSDKKVQVLLVAASKNKIAKYEEVIRGAGLTLKAIEIESISMVGSLVGNDLGNFIIVDIGARICNIIYVEKGIIKANRNIDAGGSDITRIIAKGMGIDEDRAEKMKVSSRNFFSIETRMSFPALDLIVSEVSRMIKVLCPAETGCKINSIILSGGTANLVGVQNYFSEYLKIKTIVGNPFSRIEYDKRLESAVAGMKTQFSVCVGLALKGVEQVLEKSKN